mmetsp:Transcript_125225/g.217014  ORF Transcript_125225/g.217014 Transcript_125225/m.217014 type:complete len:107 (+) Transcript_125225:1299-1619(+)
MLQETATFEWPCIPARFHYWYRRYSGVKVFRAQGIVLDGASILSQYLWQAGFQGAVNCIPFGSVHIMHPLTYLCDCQKYGWVQNYNQCRVFMGSLQKVAALHENAR